jgi:hypothetical protein
MKHHILLHCNYTQAAWNLTVDNFNLPLYGEMVAAEKPIDWIKYFESGKKKKRRGSWASCSLSAG